MIGMLKSKNLKKLGIMISFALLLGVQIAVCLYFGGQKKGFHEDEFYSFYSTNKTAGLFVNDREWLEKDQYRNEFVVLPGETFRYGLVARMQSWDVHPPFYYFLLHTACSLFTGVFSKWLGIGVNLIAFVILFFLLIYLTGKVNGKKSRLSAWLVCALWGFAPAVVSGVIFIRMYDWLTLFIVLCACIHARAVEKREMRLLTFYLPLALTVYLGFLTQYYYIVFHIFMGMGFCAWLLFSYTKSRKLQWKNLIPCLQYAGACAVGLGAAILSYPASLSHIFRGYRGTEAVSEFSNVSNTWERLRFFYGLLNDYVFGGNLLLLVAVIVILALRAGRIRSKGREIYFMLLFACTGYFFTIAKTALLLGVTSNRYQLPIYGLIVMLAIISLYEQEPLGGTGRWPGRLLAIICVLSVMITNFKGLFLDNKVFFLYEEEGDIMAYVKENAHSDVVIFYNEASPANVWRLSDELMEYDRIYLVSEGNGESITDPTIRNSDKLMVYVADHDNEEQFSEMIFEAVSQVKDRKIIARKELWTLYQFD